MRLIEAHGTCFAADGCGCGGAQRAVQYLFQWAGEDAVMSDFREFLDGAGTVTAGLMTAAERMPNNVLGVIVGLVFKIYKSSRDAQVNIYNCRTLRYLCVDILRAFHSAGAPPPPLNSPLHAQNPPNPPSIESDTKPFLPMHLKGRLSQASSRACMQSINQNTVCFAAVSQ